jgi:hypothetical protein
VKINLPSLINTLLLLGIAAVGSYWFLQWRSVRTPSEPLVAIPTGDRVARTQPLDTSPAARLFGGVVTASSASGTPSRIRLDGVIAEDGRGAGVALISVGDRPTLAYRAGEAIDGDLTLAEVRADRVIIRSSTGTQEVRLPERPPPAGIVPAR